MTIRSDVVDVLAETRRWMTAAEIAANLLARRPEYARYDLYVLHNRIRSALYAELKFSWVDNISNGRISWWRWCA